MEPLPPRYTNVRLLGQGSFATVLGADDTVLGRRVAVKTLRDDVAGDVTCHRRFAREVRTAALLGRHPHVVTVHDAGEWLGRPYLVMELLVGSVADRLRSGTPVPEPLALRWLAHAAGALDFAHTNGIVHRDVKPANLLLDELGDVRLADFGVARGDTLGAALTFVGAVVGSPGYVAPEVAAGGVATPASDRYSFALVARELLGDRPALDRGLARDPEERYPTATALVAALGGDEAATRVTAVHSKRIAPIPVTAVAPAAARPQRRHRVARTGLVAAVLAAVAAGSAVGGAVIAARVATAAPSHGGAAPETQPRETCALSPFRHDANVVVVGVSAARFCRSQAHALGLEGDHWSYRTGRELFAPDHGSAALGVVCRLRRRALTATVYDSGGRSIGVRVCGWYRSGGWRADRRA